MPVDSFAEIAAEPNLYSPPGINQPQISDDMEPDGSAISSAAQCLAIWQNFLNDNRYRIAQLGQITVKVDGNQGPFDLGLMAESGEAWKSNFSTRFLGSTAGIVAPRLVMRVKQAPTVTASKLSPDIENSFSKTSFFQETITETFRTWAKNDTFTRALTHEITHYGKAIVAFVDPNSPFPRVYRTDKAFLPEGTEVGEWDCGVCQISDRWTQSELLKRVRDRKIAAKAGWDVENCRLAIDESMPVPATATTDIYMARTWEDLDRDVTPGYSWQKGVNVIEFISTLVTEADGSVTHWIIRKSDGLELFQANYENMTMADFVCPVTFQFGNGHFYGSYGVGQILYDISVQIEKNRNHVIDNFWNRGRIIANVTEAKDLDKVRQIIMDDFIYIAGAQIAGNAAAYPALTDEFIELDKYYSKLAQDMVGAYLPEQSDPTARPLAVQAKINQLKEDERNTFTIDMFLTQWARLMWMVQRRLCRKGNPDPVAKKCLKKLLTKIQQDELDDLCELPPYQTVMGGVEQDNAQRTARLGQIIATNDPQYDQHEVRNQLDTIMLGPGGNNGLLLPPIDNPEIIEQTRMQQNEIYTMSDGHPELVSPRDNHGIHMGVLKGTPDPQTGQLNGALPQGLNTAAAAIQQGDINAAQHLAQILSLYYSHLIEHFNFAVQQKTLGAAENDWKQFIAGTGKLLGSINDEITKAIAAKQQAMAPNTNPATMPPPAVTPTGLPPAAPGQPQGAAPPSPLMPTADAAPGISPGVTS